MGYIKIYEKNYINRQKFRNKNEYIIKYIAICNLVFNIFIIISLFFKFLPTIFNNKKKLLL